MIAVLFLLFFANAISIIYSNMTCNGNFTFLSCFDSSLTVNISAIGNPISQYNISYFYNSSSHQMDINYSDNYYSINLIRNSDVIHLSVYNNTFLSIIRHGVGNILTVRLNKTAVPLSLIESISIPSLPAAASNLFNLYSVPLVLLFLVIIANLSGFPLTYKTGVIALGSFLAGLVFQNPLFYSISFISIIALALLKYGGR